MSTSKVVSPAVRDVMVRLASAMQGMSMQSTIDATTHHFAVTILSEAWARGMSRGEAKALFRKRCDEAMEVALANFDASRK